MATQNHGIELDVRHNELQNVHDAYSLPEAYRSTVITSGKDEERSPFATTQNQQNLIFRLRKTTFWLIVGLVLGWVLAIVATAVGASIAAHRLQELKFARNQISTNLSPSPSPSTPTFTNTACTPTSPSTPTFTNTACTPTSPSTPTFTNTACTPTTNCSSLPSTYAAYNNAQFSIQCATDFPTDSLELVTMWVSQFEDCINACASYNTGFEYPNSSCESLSYDVSAKRGDARLNFSNCFLKGSRSIMPVAKDVTSSAVLK